MDQQILQKIGTWIGSDDTGVSSKALCSVYLGGSPSDFYAPSDTSDFARCVGFLELLPQDEWLPLLLKMCELSKRWQAVYDNWNELLTLYREETAAGGGYCPKLYKKMSDLNL